MKKDAERPVLDDSEIVTYERVELLVNTAYVITGGSGQGGSSRRIKANFGNVDARRVLRRLVAR